MPLPTVLVMWNPWQWVGDHHPDIEVCRVHRLPVGVAGLWREATIWLCCTLDQAERRSVLTHELEHLRRGLAAPVYAAREERLVDRLAAKRLIELPELIDALRCTQNRHELADRLWVDVHTVNVRLDNLDPIETAEIEHALEGPMDSLTDLDAAMLALEHQWWPTAGRKEDVIRDLLGMSPTRYYQRLSRLLDTEAALAADPVMVNRLRRLRVKRSLQERV